MADDVRRADDPVPGEWVTVQPRDTRSLVRVGGKLVAIRRFFVTVNFSGPHPWGAGDEIIVAFGPPEHRFVALAKVKAETVDGTRLMRQSPWRPLNTRAFPRVDTSVPIAVTWGDVEYVGRTVNLSFGGAALGLEGLPEGETILVRLADLGAIEARVVASGDGPDEFARLAFLDVTADQQWEIETLILEAAPNHKAPDALAS